MTLTVIVTGVACRTTKLGPPVGLAYSEEHRSFSDARRREAQVKRWTRAKKEVLVSGNTDRLKRPAKRGMAGRPAPRATCSGLLHEPEGRKG